MFCGLVHYSQARGFWVHSPHTLENRDEIRKFGEVWGGLRKPVPNGLHYRQLGRKSETVYRRGLGKSPKTRSVLAVQYTLCQAGSIFLH
jgi:hypothetical protein